MSKRTIRNSRRKTSRRSTRGRSRRKTRVRSRRKTRMRSRRDNYKRIYKSRNKRRTVVKSRLNRKSLKKNKRTKKSKIKHGGGWLSGALSWLVERSLGDSHRVLREPGAAWRGRKEELIRALADQAIDEQAKKCKRFKIKEYDCNPRRVAAEERAERGEQSFNEHREEAEEREEPAECNKYNNEDHRIGWLKKEACLVKAGYRSDYNKDSLSYLENFYFDNIVTPGTAGYLPSLRLEDVKAVKDMDDDVVKEWLNEYAEDFRKSFFPPLDDTFSGLVIDNKREILNDMNRDRYPFADKIQLLLLLNDTATIKGHENQYE